MLFAIAQVVTMQRLGLVLGVTSSVPIVFWYIFVLVVSFGVRDLCAGSECEGHKTVQFFFVFGI